MLISIATEFERLTMGMSISDSLKKWFYTVSSGFTSLGSYISNEAKVNVRKPPNNFVLKLSWV